MMKIMVEPTSLPFIFNYRSFIGLAKGLDRNILKKGR